jgi:hypothetical protein
MIILTSINIILPEILRLIKPNNKLIGQPNGPMTHYIKKASNNHSEELKSSKNKKVRWYYDSVENKLHIKYEDNKKKYTLILTPLKNTSAKKTFNFLLQKANQQHYPEYIEFSLKDYMDYTGISSIDYAFKQLKKDVGIIKKINIEEYINIKNKRDYRWREEHPLAEGRITDNKCYVKCNPEIVENIFGGFYTLIPYWTGRLKGKAYELVDYAFYLARQKEERKNLIKKGYFTISQQSVIDNLKLLEDKKHYKQLVITPIQKAVDEINNYKDNIDDIKIEMVNDSVKTFYLKTTIKKEITEKMFPKKYYADEKENS